LADLSLLYLDQPLNNVSVRFQNFDFYAEKFYPPVPVKFQTGRVPRYWFEQFRPYEDIRMAGGEAYEIAPWALDMPAYFCVDHSLKDNIPDESRASNALGGDLEVNTVENLTQAILLNLERLAFNKMMGASSPVYSTTLSGTSQWSDYTNSAPTAAVEAARVQVTQTVAVQPNTFAVGFPVYVKLRQHPLLIDRFKYTDLKEGYLSTTQLASVFGVNNFWVLQSLYDSANEGVSLAPAAATNPASNSTSLAFIWGKNAVLGYYPAGPEKLQVSTGYTFRWLFGAPELGGTLVKRYREEKKSTDVIEVHRYHDIQNIVPGASYVFLSAVA
jgi:hypothetical protein